MKNEFVVIYSDEHIELLEELSSLFNCDWEINGDKIVVKHGESSDTNMNEYYGKMGRV